MSVAACADGAKGGTNLMGRVIVADSQPLFRDGISAIVSGLLADTGLCETVATLADMNAAIEADEEPDCVILDLALLGNTGLTDIVGMRRGLASTAFVVLAPSADPQTVHLCMMCGVAGFIPKTASHAEITNALQIVFEGGIHMPSFAGLAAPGVVSLAASQDEETDHHSLSGRQMAVLDLVQDGKSNKQIAWELSISETTVKAHMTAILRKLGVNSRAQAIVLLQRHSLPGHAAMRQSRLYATSKAA
jgi:DNA-binding NarL/FixJ family response regulator